VLLVAAARGRWRSGGGGAASVKFQPAELLAKGFKPWSLLLLGPP